MNHVNLSFSVSYQWETKIKQIVNGMRYLFPAIVNTSYLNHHGHTCPGCQKPFRKMGKTIKDSEIGSIEMMEEKIHESVINAFPYLLCKSCKPNQKGIHEYIKQHSVDPLKPIDRYQWNSRAALNHLMKQVMREHGDHMNLTHFVHHGHACLVCKESFEKDDGWYDIQRLIAAPDAFDPHLVFFVSIHRHCETTLFHNQHAYLNDLKLQIADQQEIIFLTTSH